MQEAIKLSYQGKTLRGMEHVPEVADGQKVPACILYHGFTGDKLSSHRMFLKISRALEAVGVATFRFDFLGNGESDGDHEEMTLSGEIGEALAILDFVRQDPRIDQNGISLLGMSMGGTVASVVAGDRHDQVDKLVLLCPAGPLYDLGLMKQVVDETFANSELQVVDLEGNLIGRAFGEDIKVVQTYERAECFSGDVLIVHGTQDPVVPVQVAHTYKERCYGDRATVRLVDGADHTFNKYEWERDVIEAVTEYLRP